MVKIELLGQNLQEKTQNNKLHKLFNKKVEHLKLWVYIQILLMKTYTNFFLLKGHYKNVLFSKTISEEVSQLPL